MKELSIASLLLLLCGALFAANEQDVIASVEYFYAQDGTLIGRAVNGIRQNFEYDKRGQLLAVRDANGRDLERYTYDPAGNRLSKTVNGITTTYTYDEANQLKTSTVNGETTHYRYDAAGRLVQAGDKTYYYFGANDKVTEVRQGDKVIAEFDYFMDGQIARAKYPDREENFTWDGLALVQRNEVSYINEPYVTGGNPILNSRDGVMFNDMLGSTLNIGGQSVGMTSFGESADDSAFFTGKPMISELGYSFLFRDYNPAQGKWTSSDPLGYPDGWNNLAYCNNDVKTSFDSLGGVSYTINNIKYSFDHWLYVATYAAISTHTGDSDGNNINRIHWEKEFNVYRPVYSMTCVDPNCIDNGISLGMVEGDLVASPAYKHGGTKGGSFPVVQGTPAIGAPPATDNLYCSVPKMQDSMPSQIPINKYFDPHHTHRKE